MSLREALDTIQLKPYQPIYSAKTVITESKLLKKRHDRSKVQERAPSQSVSRNSRTGYTQSSALGTLSRLSATSSKTDKLKDVDKLSVSASTNISLLSLDSNKSLPLFKKYGNFKYYTYYEKFMNIRSKVKIPRDLMPEKPTEEEVSKLVKDELFTQFELKSLDRLYEIKKAKPFRIRSKSINCLNLIEQHEKTFRPNADLYRLASVECFDFNYIDNKFGISKKYEKSQQKKEINDYEYRAQLLATFETEHDNIFPKFTARDIKYPQIYEWGTKKNKKIKHNYDEYFDDDDNNNRSAKNNYYNNVESKLAQYIRSSQKKSLTNNDKLNEKRSKTALQLHKYSSDPYNSYLKNRKTTKNTGLKLSPNLDTLIREEIRKNNGPVYFAEFNKENVELFSNASKIKLTQRYRNIFDWLSAIKVEECEHFYENPFVTNTSTNTDISNYNPETTYNFFRHESTLNVLGTKKFAIDPLENIKNDYAINKNQIPKKKLISSSGKEGCIEIMDKQVLAVTKEYEANFNLKPTNENKNKDRYINSRERLKRQLAINDLLMTRMTLDLFCL